MPPPVPSYRLAGASGSVRSQADVRCVTCTLDASAIQAVRSVAVDPLGEFTVAMAVLASRATPLVVAATLNEQAHKDLVEGFISKVGAGR